MRTLVYCPSSRSKVGSEHEDEMNSEEMMFDAKSGRMMPDSSESIHIRVIFTLQLSIFSNMPKRTDANWSALGFAEEMALCLTSTNSSSYGLTTSNLQQLASSVQRIMKEKKALYFIICSCVLYRCLNFDDAKEHKQKCNHAQYGKTSKNIATVAPNQQIANMGIKKSPETFLGRLLKLYIRKRYYIII